jgi:putative transposase
VHLIGLAREMNCVGCGSIAVTERSEVTARGYRRFRCRDCGREFNERSGGVLNRTCLRSDIVAFVLPTALPADVA